MTRYVRLLEPPDAAIYQEIRLEGLRRHPWAFASSFEEEAAQPLEVVAARLALDDQPIFGAFLGDALCGIGGLGVQELEKKRHKGTLRGIYVRPGVRRAGIGRALVSAVVEAARPHVAQLHATAAMCNEPARRLYRELGFAPYGIEPRGLQVNGRFYDQELLVLVLR